MDCWLHCTGKSVEFVAWDKPSPELAAYQEFVHREYWAEFPEFENQYCSVEYLEFPNKEAQFQERAPQVSCKQVQQWMK